MPSWLVAFDPSMTGFYTQGSDTTTHLSENMKYIKNINQCQILCKNRAYHMGARRHTFSPLVLKQSHNGALREQVSDFQYEKIKFVSPSTNVIDQSGFACNL